MFWSIFVTKKSSNILVCDSFINKIDHMIIKFSRLNCNVIAYVEIHRNTELKHAHYMLNTS